MAIMSRKKRAIAQGWDAVNKQREEEAKAKEKKSKKEVSEEEHKKKLEMLKRLGLVVEE
jgi:hypothetical protein